MVWSGSVVAALIAGCSSGAPTPEQGTTPSEAETPTEVSAPADPDGSSGCRARISALEAGPSLPGAPEFEKTRAHSLARAKGQPVLFVRAPERGEGGLPQAAMYRKALDKGASPYFTLQRIYSNLRAWPELARQVLLREGYLYTEDPTLAAAMVYFIQLPHLFQDKDVWIHRGDQVLHAVKKSRNRYEYADGPEAGKPARVMFLDRFALTPEELAEPLHRDLRGIAHAMAAREIRVRHIAPSAISAEFRYGDVWVPALLSTRGEKVELDCEVVSTEAAPELDFVRNLAVRRRPIIDTLRQAMVAQVDEALPFDEPRTEEGQQDGNLRPKWIWAYNHGWHSYEFNEDSYSVFDRFGNAKLPQVCIDFVTDSFERASGTWWGTRAEERRQKTGGLNFDELDIINRRSVDVFINYAASHPEWFDVYRVPKEERIPFRLRQEFFEHIAEHRDRYVPGDVIAIHGMKSDGKVHYHSFFVYDSDPVTGMPILVAGNSGKPRIRSWEAVMRSAPRRSIIGRIRPRLDWLERVIPPPKRVTKGEPPSLASAPI